MTYNTVFTRILQRWIHLHWCTLRQMDVNIAVIISPATSLVLRNARNDTDLLIYSSYLL